MCRRLWFGCCDFWLDFSVVWMVSVLDYGWVVSSWHRFNFLGTVFFWSCLVSATSSYADDIAHIKILDDQKQMLGVSTDGVSVSLSFLMVVLTCCWFD